MAEALELEPLDGHGLNYALDGGEDALADQDLPRGCHV